MIIDPKLKEWATDRQAQYVDAVNKHGSGAAAARALGVAKNAVNESIAVLRKKAARQGYAPAHDMTRTVPDGYLVKGVSTYYDEAGKPRAQWVKSAIDPERMAEIMRETVQSFIEGVPRIEVSDGPKDYSKDVIPWIQIGDAHLGMLAHASEIGENFDLQIAEREMCAAIGILIDEMPNCERAVINDLGDFTHAENFSATTEASGNSLDVDTRFPKMIKVYSRVLRFIVDKTLEKARHVDVIINQGNHSRTNDIWAAELLRVAYGHTGRVHILNNDSVFIAYRMGNTLVMTHHSDKCRPAQLAHVMTNDFRKDYGETEYHYIDVGHVHHGMVMKEHPGIFVESFNHLAALDKWAHDSGYRNRKSITVVLRSKTYGEIGRRVLPIQEIRDRLQSVKQETPREREVYTV
ncbi:hypothetical protein [Herbaspirillum sp. ST 5-3]|uniref:hypothetical protein n=1 Tax=Oxalobacteraceae TaxID=75682 RepID=UPI0010A53CBC|nr:hypothetical protein [Herbaspirillum sp. ST 5-3]